MRPFRKFLQILPGLIDISVNRQTDPLTDRVDLGLVRIRPQLGNGVANVIRVMAEALESGLGGIEAVLDLRR